METSGSAATPAAKCRNRLRGKFMAFPSANAHKAQTGNGPDSAVMLHDLSNYAKMHREHLMSRRHELKRAQLNQRRRVWTNLRLRTSLHVDATGVCTSYGW